MHNIKGSELPKSIDPGNFYITDDGNLYSGRNDMTPIHIGGSDINHLTVCDPATQITSDIRQLTDHDDNTKIYPVTRS